VRDDPYESTDAVFGVKDSLVVSLQKVEDEEQAKKYGVKLGCSLISYDFVLVTEEAAAKLRRKRQWRNKVARLSSLMTCPYLT
jgi:hypothetical protein